MLNHHSGNYLHAGVYATDESESMQADVMRFMAILSLCLMVIFALVQTLPMQPQTSVSEQINQPALNTASALAKPEIADAQSQTDQVALDEEIAHKRQLLADLQTESAEASQTIQEITQRASAIEVQSQNSRQSIAEREKQLLALEQSMRVRQVTLETVELKVEQSEKELASVEQKIVAAQTEATELGLAAVHSQVSHQQLELVTRPETVATITAPVSVNVDAPPRSQVTAVNHSADTPADQEQSTASGPETGFRLRFDTDSALYRQVATGGVEVYAIQGERAWRLSANGKRMVPHTLPSSVHEMDIGTLPAAFAGMLSSVSADSPDSVWGVTLSSGITRSIKRFTHDNSSGVLLITDSGRVDLLANP